MMNFQIPEHRVSMVLYKNRFDKTGESFYGRVHRSNKTLSLENLISLIDERDTGISAHLVQHSAQLLHEEIMRQLRQGKAVNVLGIGTFYLAADGIVKGKNPVPADAPPLCLRFTPSAEVNKSLKKLSVSLVVQSQHDPQIDAVRDLFSQKDNEIIICGNEFLSKSSVGWLRRKSCLLFCLNLLMAKTFRLICKRISRIFCLNK